MDEAHKNILEKTEWTVHEDQLFYHVFNHGIDESIEEERKLTGKRLTKKGNTVQYAVYTG